MSFDLVMTERNDVPSFASSFLISGVLQTWRASHGGNVSPRVLYGSVFALAVGSNFGAYSFVWVAVCLFPTISVSCFKPHPLTCSFSASLAGLLWRNILQQKGLTVSPREFIRWNTVPVVVTMIVGCLVVAGEVCVMYDR